MPGADALTKSLAKGTRGGVWFLRGDEEWLKEEAIQALITAHLDPATRDFNLDQLRGTSVDPETLASIAQTPPMMAEWRVVVVRELQALASNARARGVVETLLARKIPGLALILVAADTSRARFWDTVAKSARTFDFPPLAANDLPGWLIERAEAHDIELDASAARALAAAIGSELGVLAQELGKLIDYVGERKRIRKADVEAVVGHVPRINRWDWIEMVGDARFADARALLDTILTSESGVGLLIGLGTQLLRIGVAVNGGERALGEVLGSQRWLSRRILPQARRWTPATIECAIDDLVRADRLLKSSSLDDHQVMHELLLRFEARRVAAAA